MMLKFFLILGSILLLLVIFSRQILHWALALLGRKLQKKFEEAQMEAERQGQASGYGESWQEPKAVGEVKVHVPPRQPRRRKQFTGGEYVDFEELKNQSSE